MHTDQPQRRLCHRRRQQRQRRVDACSAALSARSAPPPAAGCSRPPAPARARPVAPDMRPATQQPEWRAPLRRSETHTRRFPHGREATRRGWSSRRRRRDVAASLAAGKPRAHAASRQCLDLRSGRELCAQGEASADHRVHQHGQPIRAGLQHKKVLLSVIQPSVRWRRQQLSSTQVALCTGRRLEAHPGSMLVAPPQISSRSAAVPSPCRKVRHASTCSR